MNSGDKFPFENGSVNAFYSSMTLEHLYPKQIPFILNEIYRTLKKKGKFRIVVPDIEIGIRWYLENPRKLKDKTSPRQNDPLLQKTKLGYLISWIHTPDGSGYTNGHRMAFDFETLSEFLKNAAFRNIKRMRYNRCSEIFKNKDIPRYKECGLYVECTK